ncbi:G-type lectin S-receptor-like serine/threonine-protein kinase [Hibiscus syriacus]|uniref:Receptor-like serine/threonine-protein kinase n=1 Tax=Hibiscus syriacus TaxID=106335 RepID=A0A6A3CW77_HIBSY|nr:G-type lectin S-receptor-like serine/threonine-protein kinase At4g27290 [Hibiscus syriacus]KAE8733593.1 G-type lectin S-receptor-like serine/threonine-protein kinase [Hibiscus syriacus]
MEVFAILLLCSFLFANLTISTAVDTLNATEILKDGDTIVSAGGRFELGFFSPSNSTKNKYLGIWYKQIPLKTAVWVANRESPLNDSSAVLKLTSQGILILQIHNGTTIWRSNISRPARNPSAKLFDSGNLVVKDENERNPENFLWQSFDYPCDTLLQGMKLGRDLVRGLDRPLSSWRTPDDPAPGNFTYRFEVGGFPELILREGSVIRFRPGPWNGIRFSGTPELKPNKFFTVSVVINDKEVYDTYVLHNSSVLSRMVLSHDGLWERLTWTDRTQSWQVFVTVQMDPCDSYGLCGAYGSCNASNSVKCSCLKGFVPKFQKDWDTQNWSHGCVRRTTLNCSSDRFLKYSNVKLPDSRQSWFSYSINLDECKNLCTRNCSCTAYSNLDIRDGGSGCMLWFVDLVDIQQFSENGQDLYLRMAASELESTKSKDKERIWVAFISMLSAAVLIFGLTLILYIWRKRRHENPGLTTSTFIPESGLGVKNQNEEFELTSFDLATIVLATDNFSIKNKLGQGGFGSVYKGLLKDGREIAVKRLLRSSGGGLEEFKNEVMHIAKLQHRNLVKLLGCCIHADEKILIYEFMPNKSLDFFISDETQSKPLDWPTRYNIINGIARGLLYLHQDSRQRIIHRDLKAGNVLLDYEMNPKISDFGLARSFGEKETEANTKKVVGTYGYMAPEYAIDGLYSIKSDVFSYGVLVLEIVTGKRNRGFCHPDHHLNLLGHAWRLFGEGKSMELMASTARETCNPSEMLRSIHVGLLCVQQSPEDRPNMASVVLMLGSQGPLPNPKQPGFFTERDVIESTSSSSNTQKLLSSNDFTIRLSESR